MNTIFHQITQVRRNGRWVSFVHWFILFAVIIWLWGCQRTSNSETVNMETINADSTSFIAISEVTHAQGFNIEYYQNFKVVHIFQPFQDQQDTLRYVLLPKGVTVPESFEKLPVIHIPVENLFVLSTTHVALTEALDANVVIKGVSNIQHICDTSLRRRTEAGEILEVGGEGNLNMEAIIAANPDVVMASGMQSAMFRKFNVLLQANIPVLVNSEWLESTLLGRAEWIKLMGALLNKEAEANAHFDAVFQEYQRLQALAATVDDSDRKSVINGIPYKGTWYVAGGNSYFANLLKDAHARYHWADTETTGSLSMDFESVYPIALEADFWFPGEFINTKEGLLAKDARFADFKSVQTGDVFSNNLQMCEGGGNAYWVSGIVNPHLILGDFIKILYPDLLPDYELYYHKMIE